MMKNKVIHMIGIGGISMSGIAEILHEKGNVVTGSDAVKNKNTDYLTEKGINITIGEDPSLVDKADIVIYTAAISKDHPELKRAYELHKEVYERAKFLGLMTKEYQHVLCISGTHGKSTTTGMIASCFLEDKKNPTIQIGAILPKIKANYYVGGNENFIMEACEYVDSFLNFYPTSAIILNIDDDHLDYFKNMANVLKSYTKYVHLIAKDGNLILNADDPNTMQIKYPDNINVYTYGINNNANLLAKNITYNTLGYPEFDVYYNEQLIFHLNLNILGNHNIYNALAATLMCLIHGVSKTAIKKGIEEYHGVERRFELVGTYKDNILVYDDYGHHPTEIKATYEALKQIKCHENYVVFQSHTYSRTKEHLEEFADVLKNFDNIIIAPIYPAREENIYNVHESDLVDLIKPYNQKVIFIETFDKIVDYLKNNLKDNDLVITIGAGPVNEVGLRLLEK